ncbi:MAG: DJ-1/PfpI family protein [Bacteroidia bacterium]
MERRKFIASTALLGIGATAAIATNGLNKNTLRSFSQSQSNETPGEDLITVACAISKGTTEIDYVGPCAAFETWLYDETLKKYKPRFKIYTVSETLDPVDNRIANYTFETVPQPKIVLVPAQQGSDALLAWLKKMHESAELIMSVCVGARHLAKAGLLDGLNATTHHESIDRFAKDYPAVNWIKGVRFVEAKNICTAGGLTAGIDLGLRIVDRYLGRESAQKVADHLEYSGSGWIVN